MTKLLLLVAALGACTQQQDPTPIDQLSTAYGNTTLEIVARGQLDVELHIAGPAGACAVLGDDVVAKFDGVPMRVARGGYDTDSNGCYPIAFWVSPLPSAEIAAYEATTSTSDLVIEDHSAQWTVGSTRLFANQFTIDATASTIVWEDVKDITTAIVRPAAPITLDGNTIHYPAGTDISWVTATATPTPMHCVGPTTCRVSLEGTRTFGPINP
jgi:hypothetical protein